MVILLYLLNSIIHLSNNLGLYGEWHCDSKVACPRTQHNGLKPGPLNPKASAPDLSPVIFIQEILHRERYVPRKGAQGVSGLHTLPCLAWRRLGMSREEWVRFVNKYWDRCFQYLGLGNILTSSVASMINNLHLFELWLCSRRQIYTRVF